MYAARLLLPVLAAALAGTALTLPACNVEAAPKPENYWNVDHVRRGMKGHGRTVMSGTKVEEFQAEVLGVLKNTSPGRDLVLCRLSGLDLEKSGVIAGMSGSPIYLDNKLLGAVAYAWAFGKEPIAGVTPFSQMHGFVEAYERRDLAEQGEPQRIGLRAPLHLGGTDYLSVTVSQHSGERPPAGGDSLWLTPLQTPLAATGFTAHSLNLFRERGRHAGLVPVQGGGAGAAVTEQERNVALEPGGPLAVALITGDFDLSGIGTVTHLEGDRVYGWGHPFLGIGKCDFPLLTGFIHTIYPRQSVSFKLGSPLRPVGVISADVSTCVAGWLGRKADMLPVRMTVHRHAGEAARTFNVQVVRQRTLLPNLVLTALTNSVDMEGELPDELTAELHARIEVEGQQPIILKDTFSGAPYAGGRAPAALYGPVASLLQLLANNGYEPLRIQRVECVTHLHPGRKTAEIESVELDADTWAPGDTLKATVLLRPYRGARQRVALALKLPADLPEGPYTALVSDELSCARLDLRENATLNYPQSLAKVLEAVQLQTAAKRTALALRVPVAASGVAVGGRALPDLPPSMVQILSSSRRTGAATLAGSLTARESTDWVVQGSDSVRFTVSKSKRAAERP